MRAGAVAVSVGGDGHDVDVVGERAEVGGEAGGGEGDVDAGAVGAGGEGEVCGDAVLTYVRFLVVGGVVEGDWGIAESAGQAWWSRVGREDTDDFVGRGEGTDEDWLGVDRDIDGGDRAG